MATVSTLLNWLANEALPPPLLSFLRAHLLDPSSPSQHLLRRLTPLLTQLTTLATPLLDRVTAALAASPDLVVLAFFLGVVVFVFQVLAYLRRLMMWWTRMAMRLVFWSLVVGLGAVVWRRGLETSVQDAVFWGGKVAGFAEGIKNVFWAEYRRYEEMERSKGPGGGCGRGWGEEGVVRIGDGRGGGMGRNRNWQRADDCVGFWR